MLRPFLCLGFLTLSSVTLASWDVIYLRPGSNSHAYLKSAFGSRQVGYLSGNTQTAALWEGTDASYLNLHPASATASVINHTNGSMHVGYATISNKTVAGYWTGTSNNFVPLTNPINDPSFATAVDGGTQVGQATINSVQHAVMWSGTIASMVDLHPANATQSFAIALGGGMQGGWATVGGIKSAHLWSGSAASALNLHPANYSQSVIEGMSATNQVGWGLAGFKFKALLWTGTRDSVVDLSPTGSEHSLAYATNGTYQVGSVNMASQTSKATVWQGTPQSAVDLHQFLSADFKDSTANAVWQTGGKLFVGGTATRTSTGNVEPVIWEYVDPNTFNFTLNKAQVAGQNSVQGTISAPPQPQSRVFTTYDNSSLVTTPPSVTLAANATVRNFQITVMAVNSTINTTIYARYGAITRSAPLALVPLVPTALAFTPTTVTGGNTVSCRVVINGVAGPSGRTIAILDNSPNATAPATVVVPPGATQVIFDIATTPVTTQKTVTVTARVSAGEKTGTFRISP
jgi:hypothetical protein